MCIRDRYQRRVHGIEQGLTTEQKEAILAKHNNFRNTIASGSVTNFSPATNMIELIWDMELEQYAQGWSDTCTMSPNPSKSTTNYATVGQNLHISLSSQQITFNPDATVAKWFNDSTIFNTSYLTQFQSSNANGFSQLIWANTKRIGCGYHQDNNSTHYLTYLVCAYYPSGNYLGSQVYKIGNIPASNCSNGTSTNFTSLCSNPEPSDFGGNVNSNCHYTCQTGNCIGKNETECVTCNQSKHRLLVNNKCVCMDGFFDDGTIEQCKQCHYSCLTCSGPLPTNCLTCATSQYRGLDSGKCICQGDYVDDGANGLCITSGCVSLVEKGLNQTQKEQILHFHNYYRNLVASGLQTGQPGATNMKAMIWDQELEQLSQAYSEQCPTGHNPHRNTTSYNQAGENIYWTWSVNGNPTLINEAPVKAWFDEVANFSNSSINPFVYQSTPVIGHYTQVAWAGSDRVGCGYYKENQTATSTVKIYLICNYFVAGNMINGAMYQIADSNHQPGSNCTNGLDNNYTSLCKNNGTSNFGSNSGNSTCESSCLTCSGETRADCTSCRPGFFLNGTTTGFCLSCHHSCATCTGSTLSQCSSCLSTDFRVLTQNTYCTCLNGYFNNGTQSTCVSCPSNCKTCSTYQNCTSCNDGYYWKSGACLACPNTCKTCLGGTINDCTSCNTNNNQAPAIASATRFACICLKTDKYIDSAGLCQDCHFTCQTCSGPSQNDCLTCNASLQRVALALNKTCPCAEGYYQKDSEWQCQQCHYTCKTCSGPEKYQCSSCNEALNWKAVSTQGTCQCKDGFFEANNACRQCHYSCLTCSGPLLSECLTCASTQYRQLNANNCKCEQGYYDNGTALCLTCPDTNCLECSTANCTVCKPGYQLTSNNTCLGCHYSCKTCSGPNENQCTSCDLNNYQIPDRLDATATIFKCKCTEASKFINASGICASCHYSCATCTGSTSSQCTSCLSTDFRVLTQNTYCTCLNGYFNNGTQSTCVSCPSNCKTCSTYQNCTSCNDGYYWKSGACLACPNTCKTCLGGTINDCTSCNTNNNQAPAIASATRFACICLKTDKYIDSAGLCQDCHFTCQTCSGPSQNDCLTCNASLQRVALALNKTCPCVEGYYQKDSEWQCQQCHYTCKTCSGPEKYECSSCNEALNWKAVSTQGTCQCKNGFFEANNACLACDSKCLTCSGSGASCLTCNSSLHRELNANQCQCAQNYKDNGNALCIPDSDCHYTCMSKTCTNNTETACLTCATDKHRIYDTAEKKCICEIGFYDDKLYSEQCFPCASACASCIGPTENDCLNCHSTCKTCSKIDNRQACSSCDQSKFRILNGSQCICIDGYYEDLNSECVKPTACPIGYVGILMKHNNGTNGIYGNICGKQCMNGTFVNQTTNVCSRYCDSSCSDCSSPENSEACTKCAYALAFLSSNPGKCLSNSSQCKELQKVAFNIKEFSPDYLNQMGYTSNQCLRSCPKGSALNSTTNYYCYPCANNCLTCSLPYNSNKCLTLNCTSGHYQRIAGTSFTCVDSCYTEGEYLDNTTLQCRKCNDTRNCLKCSGPGENCIECKEGYELLSGVCNVIKNCTGFKILVNNEVQCVAACPVEGYYTNRSALECQKCDGSCKTCSAPNNSLKCTSCEKNMYFTKCNNFFIKKIIIFQLLEHVLQLVLKQHTLQFKIIQIIRTLITIATIVTKDARIARLDQIMEIQFVVLVFQDTIYYKNLVQLHALMDIMGILHLVSAKCVQLAAKHVMEQVILNVFLVLKIQFYLQVVLVKVEFAKGLKSQKIIINLMNKLKTNQNLQQQQVHFTKQPQNLPKQSKNHQNQQANRKSQQLRKLHPNLKQ
eukprot:TRINITY_DN538_c0_g1_i2.p1 TRINITY_DN538_c0_g1~~TRINITY_DN538_c0_g1_i2.p1  ORF type:complete len:1831 (+),score=273.59 TRINITY_DN538_c0_g1_i2:3-5495(+)